MAANHTDTPRRGRTRQQPFAGWSRTAASRVHVVGGRRTATGRSPAGQLRAMISVNRRSTHSWSANSPGTGEPSVAALDIVLTSPADET
ncbi:hypothetical protein GCM10023321_39500 [Pseudonocardia eucalypti]|uniref:Uncharacterized protein n=1 Tax=Pseudonocardia eucalypti TaxID=648755 RepID=A0ABP9QAG3_9PSEU|nr:hypothetical protein [Pseudonocardia eucalypti]